MSNALMFLFLNLSYFVGEKFPSEEMNMEDSSRFLHINEYECCSIVKEEVKKGLA